MSIKIQRFRPAIALAVALLVRPALAQEAEPALPERTERTRAGASGGILLPEQGAIDVRHYDLRLRIDPGRQMIDGTLTLSAKVVAPLARAVLHLDGHLQVRGVTAGETALDFRHEDGLITAPLPEPLAAGADLSVTVTYGGTPREAPSPPWVGGFTWATAEDGTPWISTTCQGEGADLWWPCKDHPSDKAETMDLRITVPEPLICASNGVLEGEQKNADGTRTFHWRVKNPISNYCVALNIARYEALTSTFESCGGGTFPVVFWVLPEHVEKGRRALPEFVEHLKFFEEFLGPYPFRNEKYGVAETPHLGMEHQTVIAYGAEAFAIRQMRGYDWLHHHELSHEWWGNLVTCRDWKDMWIHEGFGTYMQALYQEKLKGRPGYLVELQQSRAMSNRRPVAPRESQDSKQIYFGGGSNDIYNKGAWILHSLRWVVGDETFFKLLRRFAYPDPEREKALDGTQGRFVDSADFQALAEQLSDRKLGWFFDLYLHQPALPELVVTPGETSVHLRWQTPESLPFPMPVPVRIAGKLRRVEMPEGQATIAITAGQQVEVDPDPSILKKEPRRRRRTER